MLSFQNFTNNCNKKRRACKMYGVKDCKILKSLKNIQNFTKKNTTYQLLLSAISCKDIFCYGEYLCKILSHRCLLPISTTTKIQKKKNCAPLSPQKQSEKSSSSLEDYIVCCCVCSRLDDDGNRARTSQRLISCILIIIHMGFLFVPLA